MAHNRLPRIRIFFLALSLAHLGRPARTSSQACCLVPTLEGSTDVGTNFATLEEQFLQNLSDSQNDTFDPRLVQELTTQPGSNTCHWSGSGLPQHPGVSGGAWTVGAVGGVNHCGYDSIGWNSTTINLIRQSGPSHGITLPCGFVIYQSMEIECDSSVFYVYKQNLLTETVDVPANGLEVCRDEAGDGDCGTISY
jgi:hypothetical protein